MTSTGGGADARVRDRAPAAPQLGERRDGAARALAGTRAATTAVLLATAAADDGSPAAALPWEGGTVLERLLEQLAGVGVRAAHVVTRPEWERRLAAAVEELPVDVRVQACAGVADDLRAIARIARGGRGGVVVACADMVTHREALAGLLADPRLGTAILTTAGHQGRPFAQRVRTMRGRVVSAASPYHSAHRANTGFLGALKVAAADRAALAAAAERLASLTSGPLPAGWREELAAKGGSWRLWLARRALVDGGMEWVDADAALRDENGERVDPATVALSEEAEAELARRLAVAPDDAASLLLVGLVRAGVHVGNSYLRRLFWARPLSRAAAERAAEDINLFDEDRVLLDSAVKASDGFFTTFFVSPYSRFLARWAARRGLTPNAVTLASLAIGVVAAVAFGTGTRAGLIAGAILLQVAFTTDCVDGQLARYTRTFSKLGAWLDSVFDRTKEYVVFAGLAIGASRAGHPVWLLAGSALALQTVRHTLEFSFGAARHRQIAAVPQPPLEQPRDHAGLLRERAAAQPPPPPEPFSPRELPRRALGVWRAVERVPGAIWVKKMLAFPIGERFAAISVTTALWTPHTTFVVMLAWGGFAGLYALAGRVLRSVAA